MGPAKPGSTDWKGALLNFGLQGVRQMKEGRTFAGNSTAKAKVTVPECAIKAGAEQVSHQYL